MKTDNISMIELTAQTLSHYTEGFKKLLLLVFLTYLNYLYQFYFSGNFYNLKTQIALALYMNFALCLGFFVYMRMSYVLYYRTFVKSKKRVFILNILYLLPLAFLNILRESFLFENFEKINFRKIYKRGLLVQINATVIACLFVINHKVDNPFVQLSLNSSTVYALSTAFDALKVFQKKMNLENKSESCKTGASECLRDWFLKQEAHTTTMPILTQATDALFIFKEKPENPTLNDMASLGTSLVYNSSFYTDSVCSIKRPIAWIQSDPYELFFNPIEAVLLSLVEFNLSRKYYEVTKKHLFKMAESLGEKVGILSLENQRRIASAKERIENASCRLNKR